MVSDRGDVLCGVRLNGATRKKRKRKNDGTHFGFVYAWHDRRHGKYYIGSHMGKVDDGYVCSSKSMNKAYADRPGDFERYILEWHDSTDDKSLRKKEARWLQKIKAEEFGRRFYNLSCPGRNLRRKTTQKRSERHTSATVPIVVRTVRGSATG